MHKHIHTIFSSPAEAEMAKNYLQNNGFENVTLDDAKLHVTCNENNWIPGFEMIESIGGEITDEQDLREEFDKNYHIEDNETNEKAGDETELIDEEAYIDQNLGFGDFELVEPYILETYEQIMNEMHHDEIAQN